MGYNSQFVEIWEGRPFVHVWQGRVQRDRRVNSGSNKQSDNSPGGGAFSPHVQMVPCILHLWAMLLYLAMTLGLVVNGRSAATLLMEIPAGLLYLCIPIVFFYFTAKLAFEEIPSKQVKRRRNSLYLHPMNCICPLCTMNLRCAQSSKHSRGGVKYTAFLFPPRQQTPDQRDALMVIENWNSLEVNRLLLVLAGDVEVNPGPITLHELTKELEKLTKPISFGINLKIPLEVLVSIQQNGDIESQKMALFEYIASNYKKHNITWAKIADALNLEDIARDLAANIRQKYCATDQSEETHNSSEDKMAESSEKDRPWLNPDHSFKLKKPTGGAAKSVQVEGVYYCDSNKTTAEVRASLEVGGDAACGKDIHFLAESEDTVLSVGTHLQPVKRSVWKTRSLWKEIGRALGISDDTISTIHYTDDGECLNKVLSLWIYSGKATIRDLLRALADKTVKRNDIKNEINVLKGASEESRETGFSSEETAAKTLVLGGELPLDVGPCTVNKATYNDTGALAVTYNPQEIDPAKQDEERENYQTFLNEVTKVKHPDVVRVLGVDSTQDFSVLVIEKLEPLTHYCASDKPAIPEVNQLSFLIDIANAILSFQDPCLERVKIRPNTIFVQLRGSDIQAKVCPMFVFSYHQQSKQKKQCSVDDLEWLKEICKLLHFRGNLSHLPDLPNSHILKQMIKHKWSKKESLHSKNITHIKDDLEKLHKLELAKIDLIDKLSGTDLVEMAHVHMILLGHAGVGKTSIRKHFKNEPFDPQEKTTIVAEHEILQQPIVKSPKGETQPELLITETLAAKSDTASTEEKFFFFPHNHLHGTESDKCLLTLWDTGGQPMFQDLLPCFPKLRSLYGIVFRLDNFGDSPNAETRPPCDFEPSVKSPFTHIELICRCMAYVNTFSSSTQGVLQSLSPELHKIFLSNTTESSFPKCVMIGTCKDQVALAKKLEVMEKLDTLVNRCNLSDRLICPEMMESIAFEINNTVSGTEQVECLDPGMLDLRKSIVEFTQEVAVMIPSAWLSFKIDLEKLSLNKYRSGIVPFEEVKSVAIQSGINPEAALVYFHELGIFLWYHYSQTESLKKFVIVDPKKLLEVLASIFSPTGYSRYRSQWRVLKERGLLQKELCKHLLSESKTGLPESWILEFLVEHHLAMCQDESYFIPSMLKIVTNIPDVSADQKASAIFIVSNSKFTTPGLFPRLVTVLAGVNEGITRWRLPPRKRKNSFCRNQVEFFVNEKFRVILTEFIDSIRVICLPITNGEELQNAFCVNALSTLKVQLQRSVPQWLDKLFSPFIFTFECTCAEAGTRHFLPRLPWLSDGDVLCDAGESMQLEDRHKIWLKEKPSSMIGNVHDEKDMKLRFEKAMADGKFSLQLSTILFCGTPGAGVTTLKHLLLNEQVNRVRQSTLCFEEALYYLDTNGRNLKRFQTEMMHQYLSGQARNPSMIVALSSNEKEAEEKPGEPEPNVTPPALLKDDDIVKSTAPLTTPAVPSSTEGVVQRNESYIQEPVTTGFFQPISDDLLTQCASTDELVASMADNAGDSSPLQLVRIVDCSTNPVFQDILPTFVQEITVCVSAIDLSQTLDDHSVVSSFDNDVELPGNFLSPYTNEQVVHLHSQFAPNVLVAGIHADMETKCSESRMMKNQYLSQKDSSWKQKLLLNGDEPIFPVNFNAPEFHQLEDKLLSLISSTQQKQVPFKWHILRLKIDELLNTQKRRVIGKEECEGLANKLDPQLSGKSLDAALAHFHQHGMMFYYKDILPNVIIGDIMIFSEVIGGIQKLNLSERHRHDAVVTDDSFHRVLSNITYTVDGLFTATEIVKLFLELFILAKLKKGVYVMPCLSLEILGEDKLQKFRYKSPLISPLLVCYPKAHGIFSSLICFLTSRFNTHPWPWRVQLQENPCIPLYFSRNCVQLVISGYNAAITLIDSPDLLELHLQTSKELCVQVKNAVCTGLAAVVKKLNYTDIRFETAFFCKCDIVSYQHAATHNETHWKCSVAPMTGVLEENQRVWLGSAVLDDSESLTVRNAYSKLLPVAEKWEQIGSSLGLDWSIMNEITVWHRHNPESALYEVIKQWFSKHPNPKWSDVDHAFNSTELGSVAEKVNNFEMRFYDLQSSVFSEIVAKNISVTSFRQTLMTLPNAISKENETFLIEKYFIFEQAESVKDIFLYLSFYLSFIHFSLLEHIIEHFGSSVLQQKMKLYSRDMEMFRIETSVADIIPHLSGRHEPPPHFAKLKIKLNFDPNTCTLEDLEQHRKKLGSELSLSQFALFLCEIKEG